MIGPSKDSFRSTQKEHEQVQAASSAVFLQVMPSSLGMHHITNGMDDCTEKMKFRKLFKPKDVRLHI